MAAVKLLATTKDISLARNYMIKKNTGKPKKLLNQVPDIMARKQYSLKVVSPGHLFSPVA